MGSRKESDESSEVAEILVAAAFVQGDGNVENRECQKPLQVSIMTVGDADSSTSTLLMASIISTLWDLGHSGAG
jgi:hypothetical protein